MDKYYQTKKCQADHLSIPCDMWVCKEKPYYEIHLKGGCYDSYQAGYKYSSDKSISESGLSELKRLVDAGWFSTNIKDAVAAKDRHINPQPAKE